jgi:hypothetical protein
LSPAPPRVTSARRTPPRRNVFRQVRILFLLLVLFLVAVTTCQERLRGTRWNVPLYVAVYPIAADDSAATRAYVDALEAAQFQSIDRFFEREARRYGLGLDQPVKTRLHPEIHERPPERAPDASILSTMIWSLKLRYWAYRTTRGIAEPQDVRMFVLYHDPALTPTVPHSLGLAKGHIGVVYAFAVPQMTGSNAMVIAHELLHTLGATDRYDPRTDAPLFPDGYGDPGQAPLYPQAKAEIMAGRRVLSAGHWVEPESLDEVVIGRATALEIRWPAHPVPQDR